MDQKVELVASVLEQGDGRVVLAWYHRGRLELTDLPTVGDAIGSVDEVWVNLDWGEIMPGEWLAREAS